MPISTAEQQPRQEAQDTAQSPKQGDLKAMFRQQLNEFLDLHGQERGTEQEERYKALKQELGKSLNELGIKTPDQRLALLRSARELYQKKTEQQPADEKSSVDENEENEEETPIPSDRYANLLDLKEDALTALEVDDDIKKDLVLAKREAVSKEDRLGAQLFVEATKIALRDMLPKNAQLTVGEGVALIQAITNAAEQSTKKEKGFLGTKEVPVQSLHEAAENLEVQASINNLCDTISAEKQIPPSKKKAFFVLVEKTTGVAYEEKQKTAQETEPALAA